MRRMLAIALLAAFAMTAAGQSKLTTRYNIDYDSNSFRQDTPKEALRSVLRALQDRRVEYMLAHLADPEFVDYQVRTVHGGKFDELVRSVKAKYANDPELLKNLVRFAKEAEWDIGETTASAKVKDLKDKIYFRRLESRWFLENKNTPDKPAEEKKEK